LQPIYKITASLLNHKKEIIALIAYLQRLGTDIKTNNTKTASR